MKNKLLKTILPAIPKNLLSRKVGAFTDKELPGPLASLSLKAFVEFTGIDMDEAEKPLAEYKSIGDLFIRRLKPGVRPLGTAPVHPADGKIISGGPIQDGKLDQFKGRQYSLVEFIRQTQLSEKFEGGYFATTYLSPKDYHRVHCPVDGTLFWVKHIPGELWPVNQTYVESFPQLFIENERLVIGIQTATGPVMVVMVGATNVGKMSLIPDNNWLTNQPSSMRRAREKSYEPGIELKAGDELGIFHMGSTVVCLFSKEYRDSLDSFQVPLGTCRVNSSYSPIKAK